MEKFFEFTVWGLRRDPILPYIALNYIVSYLKHDRFAVGCSRCVGAKFPSQSDTPNSRREYSTFELNRKLSVNNFIVMQMCPLRISAMSRDAPATWATTTHFACTYDKFACHTLLFMHYLESWDAITLNYLAVLGGSSQENKKWKKCIF